MSKKTPASLNIRTQGNFLGIKVNTTGDVMKDIIKRSGITNRNDFLKRVVPVAQQVLQQRVPRLQENIIQGVKIASLGAGIGITNIPVGASYEGLAQMEMTAGSYGRHKHKPHEQIPDILSRLINSKGFQVRLVATKGDSFEITTGFLPMRRAAVNFHEDMNLSYGKIPRISTVARRLDETCLPFIQSGRLGDLIEAWAANSSLSIIIAIRRELGQ